jgi:O-antigen/teichoic acid export membrane protein
VRVSEAARLGRQPQSECALWHGLLLVLAWPVLAFVAVEAPLLTRLLLGPQWVSAGSAVTGLALAAMVRTSTFSLEPLFATAGHSMVLMRLRFVTAGLSLSLVAAGALGGVTAVAYGQVGASAAGVVLIAVALAPGLVGLLLTAWALWHMRGLLRAISPRL